MCLFYVTQQHIIISLIRVAFAVWRRGIVGVLWRVVNCPFIIIIIIIHLILYFSFPVV